MLSIGTGPRRILSALVLTIGLSGAATATTLSWGTLPEAPSGTGPAPVATPLLGSFLTAPATAAGLPVTGIPVPAAGLLLLTAVGAVAALRGRRQG